VGKKIDVAAAKVRAGSRYPSPFHETGMDKLRRRLGLAAGLTQFCVNRLELNPGAWSSQRHWHSHNDEFVVVLAGEVVLITGAGEEVLKAGDCAGFKAGEADGHHIVNRSDRPAMLLEVGTAHAEDVCDYPDIDLRSAAFRFHHKDGSPY
jgi:uncharacterized cupin superfamily protein